MNHRISTIAVLLLIVAAVGLTGCASERMMAVSEPKVISAPQSDQATLIFMRPSMLGFAVQSSVFDVTDDRVVLVGIVSAGKKVAVAAPPGKRRFMVIGEAADFLEAELAAGRTYYARVSPRIGWWKARFAFEPVDPGAADFASEFNGTGWVENTPDSQAWARDNMPSILSKKAEYLSEWLAASDKVVLRVSDGR